MSSDSEPEQEPEDYSLGRRRKDSSESRDRCVAGPEGTRGKSSWSDPTPGCRGRGSQRQSQKGRLRGALWEVPTGKGGRKKKRDT